MLQGKQDHSSNFLCKHAHLPISPFFVFCVLMQDNIDPKPTTMGIRLGGGGGGLGGKVRGLSIIFITKCKDGGF